MVRDHWVATTFVTATFRVTATNFHTDPVSFPTTRTAPPRYCLWPARHRSILIHDGASRFHENDSQR
jgi:hypothetical protein